MRLALLLFAAALSAGVPAAASDDPPLPDWVPAAVEAVVGFELAVASPLPAELSDVLASVQPPQLTAEQRRSRRERLRQEAEKKKEAERKVDPNRSTFEFPLPETRGGGTVRGNAVEVNAQQGQQIVLSGGVELAYQDVHIEAERIELDIENNSLVARGGVILDQGPRRLSGDSATFDLTSKTGTLTNASAYLEPDFYFSGAEISKVGEDRYTVVDGIFTSCDQDVPGWSFKVRRARVDVGGYAHIRGASFRVKKTPVLYFPYILWPAKLDRASGFLVAQPGYSTRRGASLSAAYYQTLGRSADTTIFTDLYSKGFIGIGDEFRYALSEGSSGIFEGYAIRDSDDHKWRWKLNLNHVSEDLPYGLRGVLTYSDLSDFRYFEEFERDFNRATLRQIHSRGFLSGNWGTHSLNLQVDSQETLIAFDDPATEPDEGREVTLRSLPEVEYRLRSTQIGSLPLYLEADASLALLDVERSATYDGSFGRVDLFPSIELPIKTWPWLSLSLTGGYRFTWYEDSLCNRDVDGTGASLGGGEPCVDNVQRFTGDSFERSTPVITADIFGPSFSRIYDKKIGDFGKFKHIIAPRITYGFVDLDDEDLSRIPLYDERDSLRSRNSMRVALINKVLGKPAEIVEEEEESGKPAETAAEDSSAEESGDKVESADADGEEGDGAPAKPAKKKKKSNGSSREVLSFELAQSFSFDDQQPLQRGDGRTDKAGPLSALLRFNPTDGTSLKVEVFYSTLFSRVTSTTLSGTYLLPRDNLVGLTYVNRVNAVNGATQSDQIRLWTGLNLIPKKLKVQAQINYDLKESTLQQQRYMLHYTGSCYGIQLEFRDAQFNALSGERDQDYRIAITLKNVGTFLDLSGRVSGSGGF